MNLQEVYINSINILRTAQKDSPELEAGVLIHSVTGRDRAYIYAHGEDSLNEGDRSEIYRRTLMRASGVPLQHITGYQEFMSLNFKVSPDVLIPRSETEILVEHVIGRIKDRADRANKADRADKANGAYKAERADRGARTDKAGETVVEDCRTQLPEQPYILDLGTGSGCIALSLLHFVPGSKAVAVDISLAALKIARANAAMMGLEDRIRLLHGDLYEACAGLRPDEKAFDVIVSNPPYISASEMYSLSPEVRDHEPGAALCGGTDGLCFFRRIFHECMPFISKGGIIAVEVGIGQVGEVSEMMAGSIFDNIMVVPDLSGIGRVVSGIAV